MLIKILLACLLMTGAVFVFQRKLLYHPTHRDPETELLPWIVQTETVGYVRPVANPAGVWLICHGNGGQAAMRDYLVEEVAADTTVYVLEYPGFGDRPGRPSRSHINQAATEAYQRIRAQHPGVPVGVIGESIGSGPAAHLASASPRPDKIVLLVPFDQLHRVVARHLPLVPVRWLLLDHWDNVAALRDYPGPLEIYAVEDDEVIPVARAKALAAALPQARLIMLPGGHNTWQMNAPLSLTADVAPVAPSDGP